MKNVIEELSGVIAEYKELFNSIPEELFINKPAPGKWSKKEVIGHLIDSAHNNYRRFISGQYEEQPHIWYNQDIWVAQNNYQRMDRSDLIQLWVLMNERICAVLVNMDPSHFTRTCNTGRVGVEEHTLEFLAHDYVAHLKHHLKQIFPERQI